MKVEVTPEDVVQFGKLLDEIGLHGEYMRRVLRDATVEDRLEGLDLDLLLKHYDPDTVLKHYDPDTVLKHYDPDTVLNHYSADEIEAYLQKRKRKQ